MKSELLDSILPIAYGSVFLVLWNIKRFSRQPNVKPFAQSGLLRSACFAFAGLLLSLDKLKIFFFPRQIPKEIQNMILRPKICSKMLPERVVVVKQEK